MPIPRSLCPQCGYLNGAHALPLPSASVFLLCLNCGAVNQMDDQFRLTPTTKDDLAKLNDYQRSMLDLMQRQIRERSPLMKPEKPS
jgi:hypothetical protein